MALAGADGKKAAMLLAKSQADGVAIMAEITRTALERFLLPDTQPLAQSTLYNDTERQQLADAFAATNATADLLGRSRIRLMLRRAKGGKRYAQESNFEVFDDRKALEPMPPLEALAYFRSLVPTLGVDPQRWGDGMRRHAFTLAVDTEGVVLSKVQKAIFDRLATGRGISSAPKEIESILNDAGISPKNAGYSENVFRTNMMDSYQTGSTEARQDPDVAPSFPTWRFLGIDDGRQRDSHAVHFGKYYPNSASFAEIRDSVKGEFDGYQCRCTDQAIYITDWEKLQSEGVEVETSW